MDGATFSHKIFDALQEFDRTVQPFGLYAARDVPLQPNSQKIVSLFQKQVALRNDLSEIRGFCDGLSRVGWWSVLDTPHFYLTVADFGSVTLQMVRVSKIKVRQYGSSYHLDKHESYDQRWGQLSLDKQLFDLQNQRAQNDWQMLLFVGFDKAPRSFGRELSELKPHQKRANYGIEFFERSWDDSIGRGFKIKAALWMHQMAGFNGLK